VLDNDGLCSPVAAQFMRQRHRAGRCTRVSAPKLAWLIPRVSGSSMGPAGRSRRSIIGVWLPAGSVRAKESPIRRPRRARSCTFLAVVPRTEPRLVVRRDRGSWKRINGSPAARRGPLPAVIQTLEPLAWRLALGGGGHRDEVVRTDPGGQAGVANFANHLLGGHFAATEEPELLARDIANVLC